MATKNISLLLNLHHPYLRFTDDEAIENLLHNTFLFEKITNIYIPLLNMLAKLELEQIKFKIGVVFSAPLCELLSDPVVKAQYIAYLDNLIELGKKELIRTKSSKELNHNAELNFEKVSEAKRYFTEVYDQNLLRHFSNYAKKGLIEILATCGTYVFMPHYADMPEILNAQVETGLNAVRHYFGVSAEGFFMPEMGFTPGIEKVLRMYGLSYTIISSQSFLLGPQVPEKGIFVPARCYNCLSLFASDSVEINYNKNPVYKNRNVDISFDLEMNELKPFIKNGQARSRSGFCYWNNSSLDTDFSAKSIDSNEFVYNDENAFNQVVLDADDFVSLYDEKLTKAAELLENTDVSLTCVFDENAIFRTWAEGMDWFEQIIRKFVESDIKVSSFSDLLFDKFSLQKIYPYFGSGSRESYGEDYLSAKNGWMIRYLRKACSRIVDLAGRFSDETGLKERLLNLGARELMLAQSSELAMLIDKNLYSEFAEKNFTDSIVAFNAVFDALGSNTVSTEWLCNLEKKHPIFPWMNFRIFSQKK